MSKILYISASTQEKNIGVNGYGTEESQMQSLADMLAVKLKEEKGDIIIYRNTGSMTLEQTVADSNNKKADYHLALHSNAGGGKGTECYYWYATKPEGKKWAECIYNAVAPLTVSTDRGCLPDNVLYKDGLFETRCTNAWACLIEIMFHDNPVDVADFYVKKTRIVDALARAIYGYFGMTFASDQHPILHPDTKNYETILREVTPWANIYLEDLKTINRDGHNWKGLIEKLYYTTPK
jgi:N-acetylmuramoyl-L-alanine amidase